MTLSAFLDLPPAIAIHVVAALTATVLGPVAIFARRARRQRPRLHRAAGYCWVLSMLVTAFSAVFIQGDQGPRLAGFGPIHLLIPVTLYSLYLAFRQLRRGDIVGHGQAMQSLYLGACLGAGALALWPDRLIGRWLWGILSLGSP